MESYRAKTSDNWYATVCRNKKSGKYHVYSFLCNFSEPKKLIDKEYKPVQIVPITNVEAFLFFVYWSKVPVRDTVYKFDFFKHVCGANFTDELRKEFEEK